MVADNEPRMDAEDDAPRDESPVAPDAQAEVQAASNELPEGLPEEVEIAAIAANARRKKLGIRVASGVVLGALAAAAVFGVARKAAPC